MARHRRSPQARARKLDKLRTEQAARNAARVAADPRRKVHANAFPEAPPAYQGVARTLSSGL
jgi:hypothetical protein